MKCYRGGSTGNSGADGGSSLSWRAKGSLVEHCDGTGGVSEMQPLKKAGRRKRGQAEGTRYAKVQNREKRCVQETKGPRGRGGQWALQGGTQRWVVGQRPVHRRVRGGSGEKGRCELRGDLIGRADCHQFTIHLPPHPFPYPLPLFSCPCLSIGTPKERTPVSHFDNKVVQLQGSFRDVYSLLRRWVRFGEELWADCGGHRLTA